MKKKIPLLCKTCLVLLPLLLLALSSCNAIIPKWDGKLWAGSSADKAIDRSQTKERIDCGDKAFDDYVCMSYEDFQSFYETYVLGCKQWNSGMRMMSIGDAKKDISGVKAR